MDKVVTGVGVIGCGGISAVHIAALTQMENVKLVAVCDIRPERLSAAEQSTGAQGYADWRALLADPAVEVVHLCVPHYLHAPMAIEALKLGKHVLTEKPMATTTADARAMIAASDESTGTLGVIFQNRYNRAVVRAREILASGRLGGFVGAMASVCWKREAPYYTESGWRGSKQTEGAGTLINQAIHTLDLLSYLGGPIDKVRGAVFTGLLEGVIEVEDNVSAVALYEGGQRAVIHTTNNYVTDSPVVLELQLEKGALRLVGPKLYQVVNGEETLLESGAAPSLSAKAYWGSGHAEQIAGYYDSVQSGQKFWIDGRSGFPALALVEAIVKSSGESRWVTLEKA